VKRNEFMVTICLFSCVFVSCAQRMNRTAERPAGLGGTDLYISFRNPDGDWTGPRNMGPEINTPAVEAFASTSPDGRYLFFASSPNGNVDIYWVDAAFLAKLRPDGLK
jgi:hypothetical protein